MKKLFCLLMCTMLTILSAFAEPAPNATSETAARWAERTLEYLNRQTNKSPTAISRTLGYAGLTMYESVVNSDPRYRSVANELSGLGTLPKPEIGKIYDWETVLNASQARIVRLVWRPSAREYGFKSVTFLETLEAEILGQRRLAVQDTNVINRSIAYGKAIAEAIFVWSKTDGGHDMQFNSFDREYVYPMGENYWVPPLVGQSSVRMPLHPYWGSNRSFIPANGVIPVAKMIPYDTTRGSAYFKQMSEIYSIQKSLTQTQKEVANWWGDDPAYTTAPPGHSYNIAIILVRQQKPDLVTSAMTFAKVGMASAESFINCWKNKYTYHTERPAAYINKFIDKDFVQYWPEPPFPGFPSGHSTQMAAAAEVLSSIFGDDVAFVDNTHQGRTKDTQRNVDYKPRNFTKISQIAEECGISRLYGGIHTSQDNEVGLREGKKIGKNIARMKWTN